MVFIRCEASAHAKSIVSLMDFNDFAVRWHKNLYFHCPNHCLYKVWWFWGLRHSLPNLIKTMAWAIQIQIFMSSNCKIIEIHWENNTFRMRQSLKHYETNGSGNENTDFIGVVLLISWFFWIGLAATSSCKNTYTLKKYYIYMYIYIYTHIYMYMYIYI